MLNIIESFSTLTGLHINCSKIFIIMGGAITIEAERIAGEIGIQSASLPITYLGLPLINGGLGIKECLLFIIRDFTWRFQNQNGWCLYPSRALSGHKTALAYSLFQHIQTSKFDEGVQDSLIW